MPTHTIQDWLEADKLNRGQAARDDEIVKDIAGSIDQGEYSILRLVQDLGPFLGSDENLVSVARALSIISPVLANLQTEVSRQDVSILSTYFCTRLENKDDIPSFRAGIHEVASCLQALLNRNRLLRDDIASIATAVFSLSKNNFFKDLKPATRLALYNIIDFIFRKKRDVIIKAELSEGYVEKLVTLAQFERNPACLSVLFALFSHMSRTWSAQEPELLRLWDTMQRYWPVTAGGSAQDSSQPSMDQLRELLLDCFQSNDFYASHVIPMCLEKLDVTQDLSANTKTEVLTTLARCIDIYSPSALTAWYSKVWESLKFEIWNGENDDFIKASLKVLYTMSATLSTNDYDWNTSDNPLALYIVGASKECSVRIHDLKKQYIAPSGLILCALASGSAYAFYLVIKTVLPGLNVLWQDLRLGSEKNLMLGVFNNILVARLAQQDITLPPAGDDSQTPKAEEYALASLKTMRTDFAAFSENLVDIYFGAVASSDEQARLSGVSDSMRGPSPDLSYGVSAIKGLTMLFEIPKFISAVEKGMIVQKFNEFALNAEQDAEVRVAVIEALQKISAMEPQIFEDITVPMFVEKLSERLSSDAETRQQELDSVLAQLESLIEICCTVVCKDSKSDHPSSGNSHRNFDTMTRKLLAKLKTVLQSRGQMEYAHAIVATIVDGLEKFDRTVEAADSAGSTRRIPTTEQDATGPYTYIVSELFAIVVSSKKDGIGKPYTGIKTSPVGEEYDDTFVNLVGRTSMIALRSHLTTDVNNFLLAQDEKTTLVRSLYNDTLSSSHEPGQNRLENGSSDKCLANSLSMYLLAGHSNKTSNRPEIEYTETAAAMIKNAVSLKSGASRFSQIAMLWMLQLLVNKYGASKKPLTDGTKLLDVMKAQIEATPSMKASQVARVYQVLAYFAAASLASFDSTMSPLINLMVDVIKNPVYGRKVAQSFRILLEPSEILTKENFCTIRLLRKPRLFNMAVEPMITLWQTSTDMTLKDNYLIAISSILVYMDAAHLTEGTMPERLIPVILSGLTVRDDDRAKVAFLKTLVQLVPLCTKIIQDHLDSVLTRVFDRLRNTYDSPSDGSVECRVLALEVLILLMRHAKPSLLLQRSNRVVPELDLAKDDCAWEVRKKAVECSMDWWLLVDRN